MPKPNHTGPRFSTAVQNLSALYPAPLCQSQGLHNATAGSKAFAAPYHTLLMQNHSATTLCIAIASLYLSLLNFASA